jgi:hypothetical protein
MPRAKRPVSAPAPVTPPSPPKPLTLDQMIETLVAFRAQHPELAAKPVELPWDPGHTTLRSHAAIGLTGVSAGFDWDQGRVFVHAQERVGRVLAEVRRRLSVQEDILLGIALQVRRAEEDPVKAIAAIQQRLDRGRERIHNLAAAEKTSTEI